MRACVGKSEQSGGGSRTAPTGFPRKAWLCREAAPF